MTTSTDGKMAEGAMVADRYRVIRVLGEGGMGVVYAAEHVLMRKEVALKVLHGEMCTMPEIVARFEREAIAAAHIEHPNVAGATDFGRLPDGACYLVLELLKGTSLRDEIAKGPIPLERALVIMRGVANGVAAAHAKGIVHRDIKPENVMLVDRDGLHDFVKVLDFGIAKMDASHHVAGDQAASQNIVTRVGTIFGTPEYMAPEQAVGDKVDARADIFAMGVMFLEMLSGKCPFKGEVLMVLRERIMMTTPLDLSAVTSEPVKALIKKMLERMPDDRLQSANELLAAIDRLEAAPTPAFQTMSNVEEPTRSTMALPSLTASLANIESGERPRWLMPTALAASAAGLVILIVALASSGPEMKGEARLEAANVVAQHHHTTTGPVAAKQALPPVPSDRSGLSPAPSLGDSSATADPPAPSDSAAPTDEPAPDPSAAPTASHNVVPATQAQPQPPQKRRRSGGGTRSLGSPKTWFN